jgi:hypothetical protein
MYESFTLVESLYAFTGAAAISAGLLLHKRLSKKIFLFFSGFLLLLPATVRFSGILVSAFLSIWAVLYLFEFSQKSKKPKTAFKKAFFFFLGTFTAAVCVLAINFFRSGVINFFPGTPTVSYVLQAGSEMKINAVNDEFNFFAADSPGFVEYKTDPFMKKAAVYVSKFFDVIKPYEIANNLNYYFIRNQIPFLKWLIGPMLLIPLGLSGFLVSIARFRDMKRFSIIFFYFASIALPMLVFLPLARYRIALLPFFAFFAGYYVKILILYLRKSQERPMSLLLCLLTYVIVLTWSAPSSLPLRSEDFLAYGEALEHKKGGENEIMNAYLASLYMNPDSASATMHLSNFLMAKNNFSDARKVLDAYCQKHNDPKIKIMLASSMMGTGAPAEALEILKKLPPPQERKAQLNYFYQFGECMRLLGGADKALEYFSNADKLAETAAEKEAIARARDKLTAGPARNPKE